MHFTPTLSSWLNLVERFFRDLTDFLTEGSFISVKKLTDSIMTYLAERNRNPKRYAWKAKGEVILRKIHAARESLNPATNV
jgi:transposase